QSRASVGRRARRLALELGRLEGVTATLLDGASYAGGGALPLSELPTKVVRLEAAGMSAAELAAKLRAADPPVIVRVFKDAVNLDLRTVLPDELRALTCAVREVLPEASR
ncbi:MAG TPA: L-seryl-tRNA(Sec) selenium transferase, partial [Gammaproteobacteria bacterium]|nr:L-seryl-tRNA(Sec) selenium transferase [Gammaproteobacteria bacterium]